MVPVGGGVSFFYLFLLPIHIVPSPLSLSFASHTPASTFSSSTLLFLVLPQLLRRFPLRLTYPLTEYQDVLLPDVKLGNLFPKSGFDSEEQFNIVLGDKRY